MHFLYILIILTSKVNKKSNTDLFTVHTSRSLSTLSKKYIMLMFPELAPDIDVCILKSNSNLENTTVWYQRWRLWCFRSCSTWWQLHGAQTKQQLSLTVKCYPKEQTENPWLSSCISWLLYEQEKGNIRTFQTTETVLLKILFINSICAFYNLTAHKLNPNHPPVLPPSPHDRLDGKGYSFQRKMGKKKKKNTKKAQPALTVSLRAVRTCSSLSHLQNRDTQEGSTHFTHQSYTFNQQ